MVALTAAVSLFTGVPGDARGAAREAAAAERDAIAGEAQSFLAGILPAAMAIAIESVRVEGDWAFVTLRPERGGSAAEALAPAAAELLRTYALMNRDGDRWVLKAWVVGPTEISWSGWWTSFAAPRSIFPDQPG